MDNQYFKNLERYNRGEKQSDQNILLRLDKKIRETKEHLTINQVIDYVIYKGKYIVLVDMKVNFYGNDIDIKKVHVITL
jgi:hypothetical protein